MSLTPEPSPGFIPRKEFQTSGPKRNPSSFSLLCLAGSNLLRLYAFPSSVVSVFRRFFEQRNAIQSEKTDPHNNFTQFELEGKLWTNKSLSSERLLVEMLAIIYQSGYTYLSTIDYGRESDDRLAIAFSRPSLSSEFSTVSSSSSPKIPSLPLIPDRPKPRVPFALSFPSSTVLRVICPPLHSTPAILQAVRVAWPRGVQSEKKVGENSFEFKLKGYKWFQEDTFATDSLRYILALLSSLDTQSFTLQASISMTNRARNKDLWIFTGPAPPDDFETPPPSILNSNSQQSLGLHRRLASEPVGSSPSSPPPPSYHPPRAATENVGRGSPHYPHASPAGSSSSLPPSNLRKAAPRAQVPVSVHDADVDMPVGYRADLPSTISDSVEDMTGVGAAQPTPDVFYSTPPFGDASAVAIPLSPQAATSLSSSPRETPPLQQSHTPSSESYPEDAPTTPSPAQDDMEGELLSPGVFKDSGIYRDSAFSTNTDISAEIPIKWTGAHRESQQNAGERRISEAPKFPGGWEPTPIEEKEELDATPLDIHLDQAKEPERPVRDVRVASPEITRPEYQSRQSEAGLIGTTTPPDSIPPVPTNASISKGKEREGTGSSGTGGSGIGWVFVNIEGQNGDTVPVTTSPASEGAQTSPPAVEPNQGDKGTPVETPSAPKPPTDTPSKKAIVIVDDKEPKKGKSKKDSSRIKRFLSITRRDSNKVVDEPHAVLAKRPRMRSLRSTPEAKRNENNRRSFD